VKERATTGNLRLLHSLPGRVRFRFESDRQTIPDLDVILEIPGVEEVTFNKITNSLLVTYDTVLLSEKAILSRIRKRLPGIRFSLKTPGGEGPRANGNLLSQLIYHGGSKTNAAVNSALGGRADLTSIVPTGLIAWGLKELIRNPVMPKWYDILRAAESTLNHCSRRYEKETR